MGYGREGGEVPVGEALPNGPAMPLHVTVQHGRLSVDLREAEVSEVLARLARATGIAILGDLGSGIRVSVQFTDAELEYGLRRLLRLASLSHACRYAQGSTGTVVLQEVRVFRAAPEGPSRLRNASEHDPAERMAGPVTPRGKAGEITRHVREGHGSDGLSRADPRRPRPPAE
jgi:hypothetical protein